MIINKDTAKKNKVNLIIIHCVFPITIGGLFYILFRSTTLRMFSWFDFIGIDKMIQYARALTVEIKNHIPIWTYYSLPDGLWMYSFTSSILIYWNNEWQKVKKWIIIPIINGIFVEILQGFNLFPGTFDILDLIFSIFGITLSVIFINYKLNKNV